MQHAPPASPLQGGGYTFAASVADALLHQFTEYARFAVENGDFVADESYEKVLQGLQVAGPQAGTTVLHSLLEWRFQSLETAKATRAIGDSSIAIRKRLVIEALSLEASLRLVGGDPLSVSADVTRSLENLSFDWILNADKYADTRYPELNRLRERVILSASQLLGELSAVALDSITDRFLQELAMRLKAESNSPQRQELYNLCHGLRFLRLHADSPTQLRSAINFLESVFPLKHVAPDKKSRLQQAIADMLTSALASLADTGDPGSFGAACDPALRKQWFATVSLLRTDLLRWLTKQAKQVGAGLPAVTVLTCLQEENALVGSIDSLVELLHKQLKDKKNATMALLCLVRCVSCFLRRLRDRSDTDRLTKWVARSVAPAVQAVAKGHLLAPEQLELMRQLCTVVAGTLPEYGIRGMVLELLATDSSQPWESAMSGLMALMSVLAEAPARLAGREPALELPATATALEAAAAVAAQAGGFGLQWVPSEDACAKLLEIVKGGHHPLEAYGTPNLIVHVSVAVSRLLAQCHQLHGYTRITNANRGPSIDIGPRDRISALPVFVAVLQLVPYVVPDTWATGGMADDLPGYTIHAEPSVRSAAVASLHRCMVALPGMRDALVGGMATFIIRLQEEYVDVIKESLALLLGMLRDWDHLAAVDTATSLAAGEAAPPPALLGIFNNVPRVEGAMLGLLCSPEVEIRRMSVELMRAARLLHRSLAARVGLAGGFAHHSNPFGAASSSGPGSGTGTEALNTGGSSAGGGAAGSSVGGAFGLSSARSSSGHYGVTVSGSNPQLDPPPLLTLPHHVRRTTTSSVAGGQIQISQQQGGPLGPLSAVMDRASSGQHHHHARRSTFGSASAFSPTSMASATPSGGIDAGSISAASVGSLGGGGLPGSIPSTPGESSAIEEIVYLADIIERLGDIYARKCYWDYGIWSEMLREWRPVPPEASFVECLSRPRSADDSQGLRWARVLCEIAREAWRCCERSAWWSHMEVAAKVQTLVVVEPTGRQVMPQEGLRGELARYYTLVAAAGPLMDASHVGDRGFTTKDLVRLLVHSARVGVDYAVLALGCIDSTCHTLVATEASYLADDYGGAGSMSGVAGGGGGSFTQPGSGTSASGGRSLARGSASRGRREESRLVHANVLRVLCSNLPQSVLTRASVLRDKIVEFVVDTARYISLSVDFTVDTQQLRYCLCMVAREAAIELGEASPQFFPPMLRKNLFDAFSLHCEDGQTPGLFRAELRRHIAVAKAQMKGRDPELLKTIESEMVDAAEMLDHAACTAMAAMLAGPLFDADAGSPGGRVIAWLDRMLTPPRDAPAGLPGGAGVANNGLGGGAGGDVGATTWGPPKEHTARAALRNLLRSNPALVSVFVDRSYSPLPRVASAYFLVLAEVYATTELPIEPHVAVALVLHKVADILPAVRDAARGMLGNLSRRLWNQDSTGLSRRTSTVTTPGGGRGAVTSIEEGEEVVDGAVVVGSLAESHQAYQQHLSASLAKDHAELAHGVVLEVLGRHLGGGGGAVSGGEVLLCLPPWLEYASFGRGWEGQWGGAVLKALCAATAQAQQGIRRAYPVQKLWATIAHNRRNIVPTLDFLLVQGIAEASSTGGGPSSSSGNLSAWGAAGPLPACAVGKQAALYLSRVAPRQTIDHLAHEAAQQMVQSGEALEEGPSRRASMGMVSSLGPSGSSRSVSMGGGGPLANPIKPVEWVRIKEFHNKASSAPVQQRLPQQQPLAVHAAAAVAAATASSSKPLTPASIALAIKRSTLDLIVKTGAAVVDTMAVAGAAAVGISSGGLTTPGNMPRGSRAQSMTGPTGHGPGGHMNSTYRSHSMTEGGRVSSGYGATTGAGGPMGSAAGTGFSDHSNSYQQSFTSPLAGQAPSASGSTGLELAAPPPPRTTMTRPEVALCLLSDVAYERDEELRPHLSALLHMAVLHADSTNPTIRQEACQLLQYLMYTLACKPLEGQGLGGGGGNAAGPGLGGGANGAPSADYARVAGVIGYLQSLGGEPLWAWELPTLAQPWVTSAGYLAAFVQLVADSFLFDNSLRERWSAEALKWACCAASRHAASRSHQVFCALTPSLSSAACTALLAALQKCLQSASAQGLDTAVEILCTLRVLLGNTPPQKLVLYPHVLAACIPLLCSSVVRVGELAAALLIQLLEAIDLSSPIVQTALVAVLPLNMDTGTETTSQPYHQQQQGPDTKNPKLAQQIGSRGTNTPTNDLAEEGTTRATGTGTSADQMSSAVLWPLGHGLLANVPGVDNDETAGGPWLALQQLLVKGLFQPETEALALEGMAAIARQIASAAARGRLRRPPSAMRDATNLAYLRPSAVYGFVDGTRNVEMVVGRAEVGLALSIAAALPWLCVHVGAGELADTAAAFLTDISTACASIGWEQLAAVLGVLSAGPPPAPPGIGAAAWLPDLAEALCGALFPTYSRLVVQRLMETVQRADERYQAAALSAMGAIFTVPGLCLGSPAWFVQRSQLIKLLSDEIGGPLGPRVLDVMHALSVFKDETGEIGPALEWRQCMDDLGESNKVCAEALRRVVEACPGSAELARASSGIGGAIGGAGGGVSGGVGGEQLLPFLPVMGTGTRTMALW